MHVRTLARLSSMQRYKKNLINANFSCEKMSNRLFYHLFAFDSLDEGVEFAVLLALEFG